MTMRLLAPVDVIIDSRESAAHPEFREEILRSGLRVSVLELPAGDFLLLAPPGKRSILIERKTVDDFANSIKDNRIWDQGRLLKEAAEKDGHSCLIILEGELRALVKRREWNIQSVLRVMDTLILEMGIPILYTPDSSSTIKWIIAKARSLGRTEEKKLLRLRVEKKPMSLNERVLYVAESVIGPTLARKLLKHFGTLRNIANASIAELMRVEGIGEVRAREIYDIFNTPWRDEE